MDVAANRNYFRFMFLKKNHLFSRKKRKKSFKYLLVKIAIMGLTDFSGSEEKVTNHRAVSDMMGVCVYVMRIEVGC